MENSLEKNICVYRKATMRERLIRSINKRCMALLVAILVTLGIVAFSVMVFIPSIWSPLCGIFYLVILFLTFWVWNELVNREFDYDNTYFHSLSIIYEMLLPFFYCVSIMGCIPENFNDGFIFVLFVMGGIFIPTLITQFAIIKLLKLIYINT